MLERPLTCHQNTNVGGFPDASITRAHYGPLLPPTNRGEDVLVRASANSPLMPATPWRWRFAARALVAVALVLAAAATPAGAAVSITTFTLSPETGGTYNTPGTPALQAGGHPDVRLEAGFSYTPASDAVRDLTISLAPGLTLDPTSPATCSEADFNLCSYRIGAGQVTVDVEGFGTRFAGAELFLLQPQPGEFARFGLRLVSADLGSFQMVAPVTQRADGGLDVAFSNFPRQAGGVNIRLDTVELPVNGSVANKPFITLPTSCTPATSMLTAVPYEPPSTPATAQSTFTPTGCPPPPEPGGGGGGGGSGATPGGGGAAGGADTRAPTISAAVVSPARWRLGSLLPRFTLAPTGTTIRFTLDEAATATLTFAKATSGRRLRGRCVRTTPANRARPRCTRYVTKGTLRQAAHVGVNRVRFQGRLTRTKRLALGRYRLTIGAVDAAGNRSRPRATFFRIVLR
jgi:hypothetical protein